MEETGDNAVANTTGQAMAAGDRKPYKRASSRSLGRTGERASKSAGTSMSGSGKRRDKTSSNSSGKRKTDVTNGTEGTSGTRARSLRKSTSMSCVNDTNTSTAKDETLLKSSSAHREARKAGRRRTASVEPVGGTKSRNRSRSSSPRRSLASGLRDLGDDTPNSDPQKPSSTNGSNGPATVATTATGSLASSSLDASEKQRKRNKSKEGRRRTMGEAAATGEKRSSRRNLIDASARKQTSRRTLSDGSNKDKKALLLGGAGAMSDASQALDGSRVSSSSMEASGKDSAAGSGMGSGSKRRNLLNAARERPSMRDVSSRRKMMAESSERYSSLQDMRQQHPPQTPRHSNDAERQQRRHSNEAERQMRRNSNEAAPSTRKSRGNRAGSSRKLTSERPGSSGRRTPSQKETPEDIPAMKKFDTSTAETQQQDNKILPNGGVAQGTSEAFDDMGFPTTAPAASVAAASTQDEDSRDDFGNLPDFPVSDFSFGDLNFPMFDSNFDTKDLKLKDDIKVDNAKAEEMSSKEEAKRKQQEEQQQQQKQKQETPAPASATASASKSVASASKSKLPPGHWICDNCEEEHDESDLHFCGMCGADRPKPKETTPRPKRSVRRNNTIGGGSSKRDGSKKTVRRSNTMQSQQHQEDSGGVASSGKSSGSPKRPSSAGGLRKVRSRDKPGLTTTPRSRSKGKVRPSSVGSRDKDVSLIVKCLDGGEGAAMDMEMLNQQLTTFDSIEAPPPTPMRKKKSMRRSKSDVTDDHRAGRTPTSSAPQTPRSLGKKKVPLQRSKSFEPGNDPPLQIPRNSIRQAIPRRARSSTTEYLQQLQQTKQKLDMEISAHSASNDAANGIAADELKAQSAHSLGAQSQGVRPTTLAGMRQAMMRSASSRILGGISGIASSTFTMGGASNVTGIISPFSKPKGDALLLNSDDEGDDNDEFASELQQKAAPQEATMLRDFASNPTNTDIDVSNQPRPRRLSSRNLMVNQDDDGGVPQTPRRRRASVAAARQAALANRDGHGTRTPGRRARPSSAGRLSKRNGGLPLTDDEDKKSVGSGALDYDDIDIDEGDGEDVESASGDLGYGFTPRRTRERLGRPMQRRQGAGGSLVSRSDHGAVTPKGLNARSRIRRASVAEFAVGPLPDLDSGPEPLREKAPPTPGTLKARGRLRRASLGAIQAPESEPSIPAPKLEENELPPGSNHGSRAQRVGRPGRAGRRGSLEVRDPMLQQALAHMPQDPTHAVRSDLQEEWKRQEQLKDMRKKAKDMHGRHGAGTLGGAMHAGAETLFQPEFSEFGQRGVSAEDIDDGEESGADLELAGDEDVSDLSSNDGDPMG